MKDDFTFHLFFFILSPVNFKVMTLEQLQLEEQKLRQLLYENREKQKELNQRAFVEKNGIDIGDTVEWVEGKTLKTGVIHRIEFSGVNPNYYIAHLFKSNGELGKRETRIWMWDLRDIKLIEKKK